MTIDRSTRYDFGACAVGYVTETDFYSNVTVRFRQIDGDDEAQLTLDKAEAIDLLAQVINVLMSDPTGLITAQLNGQEMAPTRGKS